MIILQTFNQMKTIFFCDGHGLTESEIENKISEVYIFSFLIVNCC